MQPYYVGVTAACDLAAGMHRQHKSMSALQLNNLATVPGKYGKAR